MLNIRAFTVSDVNRRIKSLFDSELIFQSIPVAGEISNFSNHYKTGHLYFTLKDSSSSLKAVMFSRQASRLKFIPENGMKVIALGRISVFERDGVYQLYVDDIQPDGAGALAVAFEQLKRRLSAEGLFDSSHKKSLPPFPRRIGVITSPTGAAVKDIFNVLKRRFPLAEIIFKGVSVQGDSAASELTAAVEEFDLKNCADVIIIGRGGGSAEDLWAFNDELLARAIYKCSVPVISGVGHETDFTICDFVSDMRAPTPSAAAELAVPDINSLLMQAASLTDRLFLCAENKLASEKKRLDFILSSHIFASPAMFFSSERAKLEKLLIEINSYARRRLYDEKNTFTAAAASLEKLNPLSVLLRGYSIVSKSEKIVNGVDELSCGDRLQVRMSDGSFLCEVCNIERKI